MLNIKFVTIAAPDEIWLKKFYDLYGRVFTLPEEREPIEGFRTVLSLNAQASVQKQFGPLQERITMAVDAGTGHIMGATNYIFYAYPGVENGYGVSCQLNFICVESEARRNGIARELLSQLELDLRLFSKLNVPHQPFAGFITCEQNDPDRMSSEQLVADQLASGTDPHERLAWWLRQDFHRLAFRYSQPPLNPGQEPCNYLNYFARLICDGIAPDYLPAAVLREHLRRFFYVSVGKLQVDMDANDQWREQRDLLSDIDRVIIGHP